MRLPFQVYSDLDGNLTVMDGVVIAARTGALFRTGVGAGFTYDAPGDGYEALSRTEGRAGALFGGGSGRNIVVTGGPDALCGHYRPEVTDRFSTGVFHLLVTGPSAATISDAVDVVAELTTGGTAPVGSYVATAYGETEYGSAATFTLVAAAEEGGPGAIPNATIEISAGAAQGGLFTAVDASNYVSAVDVNWTILLESDGVGKLKYLTEVIAERAEGLAYDPAGLYTSTSTGERYNPVEADDEGAEDEVEVNPFGVLTLVYSWPATPDLDIGVTFLEDTAGYGHSGSGAVGPYITWSGDDTDPAGSETVVIDLAAAWDDGVISTFADVLAAGDWYPPRGGAGPATLDVSYTIPGADSTMVIYPKSVTPAVTPVKYLRITAAGTITAAEAPWNAIVKRVPQPTREGTVYIKLTETAGVLTAVEGPFLATVMPANTATEYHFPIAISDGVGGIEQLHLGSLVWS